MTAAEGHERSRSATTEQLLASGTCTDAPDDQDASEAGGARTFAVTFFEDFEAKTKREESLSLDALADHVRVTTAATKEELPWLKFARFGALPSKGGSLRWNGNVLALSGVVGDYDGKRMSPEEAAERLDKAGITAIIYTTPSHSDEAPRWRAGAPFAGELAPDLHNQMVSRLNGILGGVLATESWTLSQAYYFGSVNGNPTHRVIVVEGTQTVDRADELDETAIGKPNGGGRARPGASPEAEIADIVAVFELIPNPLPEWDPKGGTWNEWNVIGMAAWRASGGSEKGFEEFDRWSRKSPKYDPEETRFRWDYYETSPPSQVGFGTLAHFARQAQPGWVPPSRRKFDFAAAKSALEGEREAGVVDRLVRIVLQGDPDPVETEQLANLAARRVKISRRAIKAKLKLALAKAKSARSQSRFAIEDGCLTYLKPTNTG